MVDCMQFKQIGEDVYIADTVVWKRPHLAKLGSHIAIDDHTVITTAANIGDFVHIHCLISIIGGADATFTIGNFGTVAAGCHIICRGDEHLGAGLVGPTIPIEFRDNVIGTEVIMEDFSSIATGVTLFPDVWLAEGVVVGANSVVTKPIEEPWTIWVGSPARKIKDRPREKMIRFAKELGYEF